MSKVTTIGVPNYISPQAPGVLSWHAHTQCHKADTTRDSHTFKTMCEKWVTFWNLSHNSTFAKSHFWFETWFLGVSLGQI